MPAAKEETEPTSREEKIAAHLEIPKKFVTVGFLKISTPEERISTRTVSRATEDDEDPFAGAVSENFTIKITENNEATNTLEFEMEGISAAFANAFRRTNIGSAIHGIGGYTFDKTRAS